MKIKYINPKQTRKYQRYLWTAVLLILLVKCGKEKNNLLSPDGMVDISGLYVFVTEIINNSCDFVATGRSVFLTQYVQSDNSLSIVDLDTGESLLSGTITGNNYTLSRTDIDTLGGNCIANNTIAHNGTVTVDGLTGTDVFTFDFNEDPDCFNLTDCQFARTFVAAEAEPHAVEVTGTWNGSFQSSQFPSTSVSFILEQTDANVDGTYSAGSGGSGNVDGVVSESNIYFVLNQTTEDCVGSFSGFATVNGSTLNFTFEGSDCLGNHDNGSGNAMRQ